MYLLKSNPAVLTWILQAPSELERCDMLESLLRGYMLAPDISVPTLATQTAALVASDIANLVMYSELLCLRHGTSLTYELFFYLTFFLL
jgi:hypothetical protein